MRFMILRKADQNTEAGALPSEKLLAAMGQYMEEMVKAGILLAGEGLRPTSDGVRVKFVRRDRFRDPAGSLVTKESPVIEKRVVRTPGGIRLAPPR